ncbi:MAG: ribonuclease J [Candidatus Kerfeldbacteria bacterium]|nr:ribonuclease J [Candidatus Kerfeldbacteria bacterium]
MSAYPSQPFQRRARTIQRTVTKAGSRKKIVSVPTAMISGSVQRHKLKVMIVGGAEEVGRNMTLIEYGNDVILIDCGLQFPEEDQPGVDYIIPNVSYLKGREADVKGIIITHGHYDHIGGIPHVSPMLHHPPIYGTKLTNGIIAKRQDDFRDKGQIDLREIDPNQTLQLGVFNVEFFRVNHNIPDCVGIVVHTPEGTLVHTGDFKFDLTPIMDEVTDFAKIANLGKQGVLALLSDSTNAPAPGHQISESAIGVTLDDIFRKASGRVIVGTFASLLNRLQQVIWVSEKYGRKIVIEGFSMRSNIEIAKELGYLSVHPKTVISPQEALRLPEDKVTIMCTGAQGESNAALMRIATREHRFFRVQKGDTVIFSSSVIPGNERTVQRLKDTLLKEGARVIHYEMMDVHAGGHAKAEDLKLLFRLLNPKYIVPVEGNRFLLEASKDIALQLGWSEDTVYVTTNGQVIEFSGGEGRLTKDKIPSDYVMVDGLGVGDVQEVVLRDRQLMSEDGMFVIIVTLRAQTGELVGNPDIISRGFVYMKDAKHLIEEARSKVRKICEHAGGNGARNAMYVKNKLRDDIGQFLFQRTQRRPMILPVVIEV